MGLLQNGALCKMYYLFKCACFGSVLLWLLKKSVLAESTVKLRKIREQSLNNLSLITIFLQIKKNVGINFLLCRINPNLRRI